MQGDEPYCFRCRQTYGCICDPEKFTPFAEASQIIGELESKLDQKQQEFDRLLARDTENLNRLIACQSRLGSLKSELLDMLNQYGPNLRRGSPQAGSNFCRHFEKFIVGLDSRVVERSDDKCGHILGHIDDLYATCQQPKGHSGPHL